MKIHIVGPPGSGKSYLGRKVAERFELRYIGLDDIFLMPIGEDMKTLLKDFILAQDNWVAEGIYFWPECMTAADYVFVLVPPLVVRDVRILVGRYLAQAMAKTWQVLRNMQAEVRTTHRYRRRQLAQVMGWAESAGVGKLTVFHSSSDLLRWLEQRGPLG